MPLAGWRPPACAGIAVVLVRNPQWAPKPLQPLYFGEFGNNLPSDSLSMSLPKIVRPEDLLIAVLPLPFSTANQRRTLCNDLVTN